VLPQRLPAYALLNFAPFDPGSFTPGVRVLQSREAQHMGLILLIILIILLLGAVPAWPYSRNWGYGPSGGLGLLVIIVIILLLLRVF